MFNNNKPNYDDSNSNNDGIDDNNNIYNNVCKQPAPATQTGNSLSF